MNKFLRSLAFSKRLPEPPVAHLLEPETPEKTVEELEEIIKNYEQAHDDNQVMINAMDQQIEDLRKENEELKKQLNKFTNREPS